VPCTRLSCPFRQLLSARKSPVLFCINILKAQLTERWQNSDANIDQWLDSQACQCRKQSNVSYL